MTITATVSSTRKKINATFYVGVRDYTRGMKPLNHSFNPVIFFQSRLNLYQRNRDPNMIRNEHVYAICCRPEVAGDVISGESVKTVEGYAMLNFEVANFNSLVVSS